MKIQYIFENLGVKYLCKSSNFNLEPHGPSGSNYATRHHFDFISRKNNFNTFLIFILKRIVESKTSFLTLNKKFNLLILKHFNFKFTAATNCLQYSGWRCCNSLHYYFHLMVEKLFPTLHSSKIKLNCFQCKPQRRPEKSKLLGNRAIYKHAKFKYILQCFSDAFAVHIHSVI